MNKNKIIYPKDINNDEKNKKKFIEKKEIIKK